jgi:hypothetical protein
MSGGDGLMTEEEYATYMVENGPFTGQEARLFFQGMTQMQVEGDNNGTELEISKTEYDAYMLQQKNAESNGSMVTTFHENEARMYAAGNAAGNAAESGGTYTNAEGKEVTIASDVQRSMTQAEAVAYARANYQDENGNPIFSDQDIIDTYNQFNVDHSGTMGIQAAANFFESLDEREARHNDWKANAGTAYETAANGAEEVEKEDAIAYAYDLYGGEYTEEQLEAMYEEAGAQYNEDQDDPDTANFNSFVRFLNHVANVHERDNPGEPPIGVDENGMASRYVDTGHELSGPR